MTVITNTSAGRYIAAAVRIFFPPHSVRPLRKDVDVLSRARTKETSGRSKRSTPKFTFTTHRFKPPAVYLLNSPIVMRSYSARIIYGGCPTCGFYAGKTYGKYYEQSISRVIRRICTARSKDTVLF